MEEAERIAREEHGSVKLAVISGQIIVLLCVGVLMSSFQVSERETITESWDMNWMVHI